MSHFTITEEGSPVSTPPAPGSKLLHVPCAAPTLRVFLPGQQVAWGQQRPEKTQCRDGETHQVESAVEDRREGKGKKEKSKNSLFQQQQSVRWAQQPLLHPAEIVSTASRALSQEVGFISIKR